MNIDNREVAAIAEADPEVTEKRPAVKRVHLKGR